jgi:ABC-type Fe3+/spermidine/putrescine transport system ATPase subunit
MRPMRVPVHQSMNDSGTARLVVENACLRYGQLDVLADLSLTVGSSEIVSIVGPSGCGKTTLLRCVGGLNQLNDRLDGISALRAVSVEKSL